MSGDGIDIDSEVIIRPMANGVTVFQYHDPHGVPITRHSRFAFSSEEEFILWIRKHFARCWASPMQLTQTGIELREYYENTKKRFHPGPPFAGPGDASVGCAVMDAEIKKFHDGDKAK